MIDANLISYNYIIGTILTKEEKRGRKKWGRKRKGNREKAKRISNKSGKSKMSFCKSAEEIIDHLIYVCSFLSLNEFKNRHDWARLYLHRMIYQHYKLQHAEKIKQTKTYIYIGLISRVFPNGSGHRVSIPGHTKDSKKKKNSAWYCLA